MKNAHTKKALADAINMANGNANAGGMPMPDVTTVKMVNPINEMKTAISILIGAGWQNDGRLS
jgi:hypothetical protein